MVKSAFINTALIVFAALLVGAYTITDYFFSPQKQDLQLSKVNAKKDSLQAIFANVGLRRNPPHGQPGHRHDLPDGALLPQEATNTLNRMPASNGLSLTGTSSLPQNINLDKVASSPGNAGPVNPPHGKPGHRCDIAVGAPLNSPPSNTTPTAANTQTANSAATKGLNPAHGQPGHRCDIAVGAPLNSAPAKTTVTKTGTTTNTVATNNTSNAKNVNPAHGQPGHRCDIAVGAPLDSPPPAPKIDPAKLYPFPTAVADTTSKS